MNFDLFRCSCQLLGIVSGLEAFVPSATARAQTSFVYSQTEPLWQRVEAGAVEAVGADDAEGLARRTRFALLVAPLVD